MWRAAASPRGGVALLKPGLIGFLLFVGLQRCAIPALAQPAPPAPTPVAVEAAAAAPALPATPQAMPVTLHDRLLFAVQSLGEISASDRKNVLEERLRRALEELHPPYVVQPQREGDSITLLLDGRYLVTVTRADASAANADLQTLASQWARRLEDALEKAFLENSDEYYKVALWTSLWAVVLGLLLQAVVRRLSLRYLNTPGATLRAVLWLGVACYVLYQFPRSRFVALALQNYALRPLLLLILTVAAALLASWVMRRALRRYFEQTERLQASSVHHSPRWRQRLHMLRDAAGFVSSVVLIVVAVVVYFSVLDLNLGAALAGAGFLGVGLGFAAQDVLKDFTSGVNIMIEDPFGAGDVITVGQHTGTVEHFTLRVTQLRDLTGGLITIPNSEIRVVQNLSNLWSQVDLIVPVAVETPLRAALALLEQVGNQLASERPDQVQGQAEVLGVEKVTPYGIELRMLLKTAPLMQFAVRRELLLRVLEAFRKAGFEVALQHLRVLPGSGAIPEASSEQSR